MNIKTVKTTIYILIIFLSQNLFAEQSVTQEMESWSMKAIYEPSQHQLEREKLGLVNIYDGFTDTQVNRVMDDKFGRIDHMMFTRVKSTGDDGQVLKDPESGEEVVEDDGCDD